MAAGVERLAVDTLVFTMQAGFWMLGLIATTSILGPMVFDPLADAIAGKSISNGGQSFQQRYG